MRPLVSRTKILVSFSVALLTFGLLLVTAVLTSSSSASERKLWVATPGTPNPVLQALPDAQASADPQVQAVLQKLAAANALSPTTVEEGRRAVTVYASLAGSPEKVYRVENRKIPGPGGELAIRLYAPRAGAGLPILVFFHGGGFAAGTLDDYDVPVRAVANRCGCLIVSVAYRLSPEHKFPAAVQDALAATQWVAAHAAEIGGDPQRIAVGGDGAGGNLVAVITRKARDLGGPALVYQVLIYPALDATMLTKSRLTSHDPLLPPDTMLAAEGAYIPLDVELTNPDLSPIFAKDLRGLPPALVITDRDDPLLDEASLYAGRLKDAGVPAEVVAYPGAIHGFFLMAGALDTGKDSQEKIGQALQRAFAKPRTP